MGVRSGATLGRKSKRAQYSAIEALPQREQEQIVKELVSQTPYREIKRRHGLSNVSVVKTYLERHLREIAKGMDKGRRAGAQSLMDSMSEIQSRLDKMTKACEEWLRDPEDETRYEVCPRASEVSVVWTDYDEDGKPVTRKGTLQGLIDREAGLSKLDSVRVNSGDIRKTLLDCLKLAQSQVELMARITGQLKDVALSVDVYGAVVPTLARVIIEEPTLTEAARQSLLESMEREMERHEASC